MNGLTGLTTTDGKPIHSYSYIEQLREIENRKKESVNFIFQKAAQENGLHSSVDIMVFGGNRGGGKANPYRTPVATPSGFRKMGDLKVGDLICTPYEGIQRVSEIFEQGKQTVYNFYFDDGTTLACMDNHRFWAKERPSTRFHEITARDIMNRYAIGRTGSDALRRGLTTHVEFPLCGEVEMNEKRTPADLPIPPFVLGFASNTGKWCFDTRGLRLTQKWYDAGMFVKYGVKMKKCTSDGYYYLKGLSDEDRRSITCSRRDELAYIPDMYMTASIEARWQYMRGVWYAKGGTRKGYPYLALPNKKLIEQVAQMARSLGMWASVDEVTDDPKKMGFTRVTIKAPNPAKLFIKNCYHKTLHMTATLPTSPDEQDVHTKKLLYITKSDKKQQCRCITVTGNHHLYLTDAFTINHNTITMLMEPVYDIGNKHFNGIIFRKNKDDFKNIINESKRWFSGLGQYNRSKDDMTWYFKSGAKLGLTIYDMPMAEFDAKYRGQQFAYIGIDELPQMPFEMFKFLMTANRNTVGVRSRILGTCNPDPLSWLRKFVDWWIGHDGFVIPERDGVVRYCYMPDDSVDNILWGDTPDEVYEQCKDIIDDAWDPAWEQYGYTKTSFFVKSVTFIKASLNDNKALIKSDPSYIASLLNQPAEVRAREFEGNWNVIRTGNDLIQPFHLERCFSNMQMRDDGVKRASCDVASSGGDNCVTWLKVGNHIQDVFVCQRDIYETIPLIQAKLREWGVLEQNFTYDLQGMGQIFVGAFPNAIPFNNQESCTGDDKRMYDCIKSQAAYLFAQHTQQGEWSIEPSLLERSFKVGKNLMTVRNILLKERKAIRQDMSKQDRGWCLIHKEQMKNKSLVGHSPDFIEALMMFEIFNIKKQDVKIPEFLSSRVLHRRTFTFS